jgi:hypothetical protein
VEDISALVVDYGAISHLSSTATSLAKKFQKRVDDYEGIITGVNALPTSRNNLDNANYFIKKKNEQNHSKLNKLKAFQTRMNNFSEEAKATDKRVASRITKETKAFKKANNIKVNPLVVIGNSIMTTLFPWTKTPLGRSIENWIEKGIRNTKYAIKDWYRNGGKQLLINIGGVVLIVAAVALTVLTLGAFAVLAMGVSVTSLLIMGAIGAGVGLTAQFISDLITSCVCGEFKLSSWQTYVGAGLGGLIGGIAAPVVSNVVLLGAGISGSSTLIAQSLENFTGGEKRTLGMILLNVSIDAAIGGALGKVKLPGIKGVTTGRNSFSAVFKSGITKLNRGIVSRMSLKVIFKGGIKQLYESTYGTVVTGIKQYYEDKYKDKLNSIKNLLMNFPLNKNKTVIPKIKLNIFYLDYGMFSQSRILQKSNY